jgi:hypothetical protein
MSPDLGRLIPSEKARADYLGGIDRWAEARLQKVKDPPPRMKINRRWFYPEIPLQEWQRRQLAKSARTQQQQ